LCFLGCNHMVHTLPHGHRSMIWYIHPRWCSSTIYWHAFVLTLGYLVMMLWPGIHVKWSCVVVGWQRHLNMLPTVSGFSFSMMD
jgi:hypothetical protein